MSLPRLLGSEGVASIDGDATGTASGSGGDSNRGDQPSKKSDGRPKRIQISVACENCRKRKAKCDGSRPACTPCQDRALECSYGADPDSTRMTTLKRKYQTISDRNDELEGLLRVLRDDAPSQAHAALDLIRNGAPIDTVVRMAVHGALLPADTPSGATQHVVTSNEIIKDHPNTYPSFTRRVSVTSVRGRMDVSSLLIDDPSDDHGDASASPISRFNSLDQEHDQAWSSYIDPELQGIDLTRWTDVVKDPELLAHLVSIYFAWEGPVLHWFDKDAFMEGLIHGTVEYCQPMLFSIIAAIGSVSIIGPRNRSPS